jgi:prepilin-type N-terminal cleavage/methylation domain-containing protein
MKNKQAFTLIELLVVITIIGILMGLLMPALRGARDAAKRSRAQASIQAIGVALKAYYNEYGNWPTDGTSVPNTILDSSQLNCLYNILLGTNANLSTATASPTGVNPRQITFLEVKKTDSKTVNPVIANGVYKYLVGGKTVFTDPWENSFMISFDHDGDNYTEVYRSGGALKVLGGFAIWSAGPDKKIDDMETDLNSPTKTVNRDNLASWK